MLTQYYPQKILVSELIFNEILNWNSFTHTQSDDWPFPFQPEMDAKKLKLQLNILNENETYMNFSFTKNQ